MQLLAVSWQVAEVYIQIKQLVWYILSIIWDLAFKEQNGKRRTKTEKEQKVGEEEMYRLM